jgi:hypothetical protein
MTELEPETLEQSIAACRRRVWENPADLAARLSLSWLLLFQSLLYRQREELRARLLARAARLDERSHTALRAILDQETHGTGDHLRVLRESLQHAATAMQLSVHTRERNEAARIRELAELVGAGHVVSETDEEAELILARVARAVCTESRSDFP